MPEGIREVHERAKAALPQEPPPVQARVEMQGDVPAPTGSQERGRVRTAEEASLGSGEDEGMRGDGDSMMALQDGEDDSDAALAALVRRHRARRRAS